MMQDPAERLMDEIAEEDRREAEETEHPDEEPPGADLPPGVAPSPGLEPPPPIPPPPDEDEGAEARMRRISRRSLLSGAVGIAAGLAGWRWLVTQPEEDGALRPLRRVLTANEAVAIRFFSASHRAATFPVSQAREPKPNGDEGMQDGLDPFSWRLEVLQGPADAAETLSTLTLKHIRALPREDMVTELRCIEGWSRVVHWSGARFADFAARYGPARLPRYVGLATPDGGYYVGLDAMSALHPQTLLCYEMNGEPLTEEHGAPLRLVIPVKYGIKNLKRIGAIRFTDQRPADFWAEQGYDWYAGL